VEKVAENVGYFCNFKKPTQRKQSPNRLELAQSGHPVETGWTGGGQKIGVAKMLSKIRHTDNLGDVDAWSKIRFFQTLLI
jgi:hypothetical protein